MIAAGCVGRKRREEAVPRSSSKTTIVGLDRRGQPAVRGLCPEKCPVSGASEQGFVARESEV